MVSDEIVFCGGETMASAGSPLFNEAVGDGNRIGLTFAVAFEVLSITASVPATLAIVDASTK